MHDFRYKNEEEVDIEKTTSKHNITLVNLQKYHQLSRYDIFIQNQVESDIMFRNKITNKVKRSYISLLIDLSILVVEFENEFVKNKNKRINSFTVGHVVVLRSTGHNHSGIKKENIYKQTIN